MSQQSIQPIRGSTPKPASMGGGASSVTLESGSTTEVTGNDPSNSGLTVSLMTEETGQEIVGLLKVQNDLLYRLLGALL